MEFAHIFSFVLLLSFCTFILLIYSYFIIHLLQMHYIFLYIWVEQTQTHTHTHIPYLIYFVIFPRILFPLWFSLLKFFYLSLTISSKICQTNEWKIVSFYFTLQLVPWLLVKWNILLNVITDHFYMSFSVNCLFISFVQFLLFSFFLMTGKNSLFILDPSPLSLK